MKNNRVCEILGIEKPIIQGPMAWSSFAPLVAAVSNAGGMGTLGIAAAPPQLIRTQIQETKKLTKRPFGVNVFMLPELVEEALPVFLEEMPAVIYADVLNNLDIDICKQFFAPLKNVGIKIVVKASTVKDAIIAETAGADIVVAKGWEGGGHVTPESTMILLPQVARALSIPVVGSGGIVDGHGMAAAIALGAEAIEMGTAFLCANECTIHENAKSAILAAEDNESVITAMCTHEPCRQLKNKYTDKMLSLEENYPVKEVIDEIRELARPSLKIGMHEGDIENGAIMAGMAAPMIKKIQSAEEIMDITLKEFEEVITQMSRFALE